MRAVHGQKASYHFRLIYLISAACRMGWRFARCGAEKTFIWPASCMGRGPPFSVASRPFGAIYRVPVPGLNCYGAKPFCLSEEVGWGDTLCRQPIKLPWGGRACSENRAATCCPAGHCGPWLIASGRRRFCPAKKYVPHLAQGKQHENNKRKQKPHPSHHHLGHAGKSACAHFGEDAGRS